MNEEVINEQYKYIYQLILDKRLKEAFAQLESYLWNCPDWSLKTRLEQVQTSYNYMLQYLRQGIDDPERKKLYLKLLTDTIEIADRAHIAWLRGASNRYYHVWNIQQKEDIASHTTEELVHTLESFQDDLAISGLLSDSNLDEVLKRHEDALRSLFILTWDNISWTPEDRTNAQAMLDSELLPVNDLCLFTSAVTLSLMDCFDLAKLHWLMDAYQHPNVQVSQRALVGMAFIFHIYASRLELYPELNGRLYLFTQDSSLGTDLVRIQKQITLSQETEKIDKKMREEIIPEMLKNIPPMRNTKFGFEDPDEEKDDINPDWASAIENSDLGEKLREMNELQMEGADVYMSTFAQLKNYPFFREPHNWFYPFDKQHSAVIKEFRQSGATGSILNLILESGFFCNSDKYSLFFTMQHIPQAQRDMMIGQLTEQQVEELGDRSNAQTLKKFSERPETVSNQYIHDLYRFFKLNQKRNEFRDVFKEDIRLTDIDALLGLFNANDLTDLANFFFRKKHWEEAANLFDEVSSEDLNEAAEGLQKYGYALQKLKNYERAIIFYQRADLLKPDNLWTLRHLANCYRLNRNFEEAVNYYRKVEAIEPEDPKILFYIGSCLAELSQLDEALNYFFKLDFLESDCIKAWRGIGWCSFLTDKYEQASKYYDKVIEKKPLATDYLNAGHAAWASGNIERTISLYSKATELFGNRNQFLEMFAKDRDILLEKHIHEDDIPLVLDMI